MFAGGSGGVISPTLGRTNTPGYSTLGGRGGLRPGSALGMRGHEPKDSLDDDSVGEWVTVVSKFHFVDLAGSERVSRGMWNL
jgi:hypothetical protein